MKDAVKFGFGFAAGTYLFKLCAAVADNVLDRYLKKKFDADPEFRLRVKKLSPELYIKYRKEDKDIPPCDIA